MMRRVLAAFVLLLLTVTGLTPALAQDGTPIGTPVGSPATDQPLDLAAIALWPPDLEAVGLPEFGRSGAAFRTLEQEVAAFAEQEEWAGIDLLTPLQEAGFQRRYLASLIYLQPTDEGTPAARALPGIQVAATVTEYATPEGAAAGFAFLEDETGWEGYEDVPDAVRLGDESELTRWSGVTTDGRNLAYNALDYTFREGNLVGDVIIRDYTTAEPEQAVVEALAGVLQERMAAVRATGGPGLGELVARPIDTAAINDGYTRLAGVSYRNWNQTAEELTGSEAGLQPVIDLYNYQGRLDDNSYYTVYLYRFPDAAAAAAWLADPQLMVNGGGYTDVTEVAGGAAFGEQSRVYSYGFEFGGGTVVRGYSIYAQVGDMVARVEVEAVPEPARAAVEELAAAQVACLEAGGQCEPFVVPNQLVAEETTATPRP